MKCRDIIESHDVYYIQFIRICGILSVESSNGHSNGILGIDHATHKYHEHL